MKKIYISIDFELMWGMIGLSTNLITKYAPNIEYEVESVNFILEQQKKYKIPCTYATVGAIALRNWNDYFDVVRSFPSYEDKKFSIIEHRSNNRYPESFYFAPKSVDEIIQNDLCEFGSHSFSHIYFGEKGITLDDFNYDTNTFNDIIKDRYNTSIKSYVYPRNQVRFNDQLINFGIDKYRGGGWTNFGNSKLDGMIFMRGVRLLNEFVGVQDSGKNCLDGNIPSTHFVRFNLPELLWRIQIYRIEQGLIRLKDGEHLHLWWHPHNLGINGSITRFRCMYLFDFLKRKADLYEIEFSLMSQ